MRVEDAVEFLETVLNLAETFGDLKPSLKSSFADKMVMNLSQAFNQGQQLGVSHEKMTETF